MFLKEEEFFFKMVYFVLHRFVILFAPICNPTWYVISLAPICNKLSLICNLSHDRNLIQKITYELQIGDKLQF